MNATQQTAERPTTEPQPPFKNTVIYFDGEGRPHDYVPWYVDDNGLAQPLF
jgi:hypothetical protein